MEVPGSYRQYALARDLLATPKSFDAWPDTQPPVEEMIPCVADTWYTPVFDMQDSDRDP
jgi:hypothetical protein